MARRRITVIIIVMLLTLLILPGIISAQQTIVRQATLLAVSERNGTFEGSTASLTVELVPGRGRVFLDTTPLTKFDTQISTRLAKEIACAHTQVSCLDYDFIYTIKSASPIIGGPSAGAAIAALTVAALLDMPVRNDIAITGTINSGGIIGPVGGILEKIDAATKADMHTVIIPIGERFTSAEQPAFISEGEESTPEPAQIIRIANNTAKKRIDAIQYGVDKGILVVEAATLEDILTIISGYTPQESKNIIEQPEFYRQTMGVIADQMCSRGIQLKEQADTAQAKSIYTATNLSAANTTDPFTRASTVLSRGQNASKDGAFYAGASFCFSANREFQTIILQQHDANTLGILLEDLAAQVRNFTTPSLVTVTDLQTFMLVEERILEAGELINNTRAQLAARDISQAQRSLAYAIERFNSAQSWSKFFNKPGQQIVFTEERAQLVCQQKIQEAEERRQYVGLYIPVHLESRVADLEQAYREEYANNDELCIFYASQAKASYDVIIGVIGIQDEADIQQVLNIKQQVATNTIARQATDNVYPIISYSFLEYSQSLQDSDPYAALLYAQYALEMADLSSYFTPQVTPATMPKTRSPWKPDLTLLIGFAFGLIVASTLFYAERHFILRK